MNKDQLQAAIFEKAISDSSFRAALAADPAKAIDKAFDVQFPAGVHVHVHTESASDVHFVVPAASGSTGLGDQDLDAVVGGVKAVITTVPSSGATNYMSFTPPSSSAVAPIKPASGC